MFDRKIRNHSLVDRMSASLAALLSEADICRMASNLIERISQQLVEVIKETELGVEERVDITETSYVIKCLTTITVEWLRREPTETFADYRHTNWIEDHFCQKRLLITAKRLNDIYSDIEWTANHCNQMRAYHTDYPKRVDGIS